MRLRRFLGGLAVVAIAVTLVLLLLFRAEDGSGGDQPREDEPAPTAGDVGGGTPPLRGHAPNDARHPASRPQVTETFDVRVFGPDGSPLKDADVRVYAQDGAARHAGVTDAEGRVALPPLSPDTMYEVWAATRDLDLPWRLQVPGGTRTIELRLERIPSFRIRLVDEAGEVVDGTDVRVLRRDPDSFLIVARSRPSGDGGLTVRFRPEPGATYRLDRVNADSPPRADHIDPLTVAWDPSDGDVRIDRRHVVRGVVRSAAGAPLPGALIQHRWRPDLTEVTIADAQGAFTVGVSSVGRLGRYDDAELRVVLAGAEDRDAPWTHVRARTTDAVFIIDPGPYVVVRLPRPEELGESRALPLETVPPLGCEAALLPGDALTLAVPDSSTRYSMFVGPDAGGRIAAAHDVSGATGGREVELAWTPGLRTSGRATFGDRPWSGEIQARTIDQRKRVIATTRSDDTGAFAFAGLPPGRWVLYTPDMTPWAEMEVDAGADGLILDLARGRHRNLRSGR